MSKDFSTMTKNELNAFIYQTKEELGDSLCMVAYPFQFQDLAQLADFNGDAESIRDMSLKTDAEFLMFTGWRFFAEIPGIFGCDKTIIQSNVRNDCPIADRANINSIKAAYETMKSRSTREIVPLAFVNATSEIRSFCGENNGCTCTPWNAVDVVNYHLQQGKSIFFVPANDAYNVITALNLNDDEMFTVDESVPLEEIPGDRKVYAWNVECYVHTHYTGDDIRNLKKKYSNENIKIIAHRECSQDVIDESDYQCFVGDMYQKLKNAPSGTCWGAVTVDTWVARAAKEFPDKIIVSPRPDLVCDGVEMTDIRDVAKSLQSILDHKKNGTPLITEQIVPEDHKAGAQVAYSNMFEIQKILNKEPVVNY